MPREDDREQQGTRRPGAPLMTACQPCASSPVGIDGHEGLILHEINRSDMHFKCRACDCLWLRRYAGQGSFTWVLMIGQDS